MLWQTSLLRRHLQRQLCVQKSFVTPLLTDPTLCLTLYAKNPPWLRLWTMGNAQYASTKRRLDLCRELLGPFNATHSHIFERRSINFVELWRVQTQATRLKRLQSAFTVQCQQYLEIAKDLRESVEVYNNEVRLQIATLLAYYAYARGLGDEPMSADDAELNATVIGLRRARLLELQPLFLEWLQVQYAVSLRAKDVVEIRAFLQSEDGLGQVEKQLQCFVDVPTEAHVTLVKASIGLPRLLNLETLVLGEPPQIPSIWSEFVKELSKIMAKTYVANKVHGM
jgi:hypothetical protein